MSNHVYGYVSLRDGVNEIDASLNEVISGYELGYLKLLDNELFNFPDSYIPKGKHACFSISDGPGKNTAEYLIDNTDYALGSRIPISISSKNRLGVLVSCLLAILKIDSVESIVVVMSECNEIERSVSVDAENLFDVLEHDFSQYAPPNILYEIF